MSILSRLTQPLTRFFLAQTPAPAAPQFGVVSVTDRYTLFGGAPTQYNPNVLIGTKGYRVIDQMRKDEQVKASMSFKKHSVIAGGWTVKAPTGKDDTWDPRVEIYDQLSELKGTLEQAVLEILLALDYGFSVSELVWAEDGGKIVLDQILTRRPHDIALICNPIGQLIEIRQGSVPMPVDKFIVYTYGFEFSNYYGRTDLEAAYRAWWSKDNAYKWMSMLLERLGIPPVFALYNPNAYKDQNITKLQQVMESLQAATVGSIPRATKDDLEMWSPELAGQVSTVFIPAMEMYNKDISRALLMPGLIGLADEGQTGSLARSRVNFDVFMLVLEHLKGEIRDRVINEQIVKPIMWFNYGVTDKNEMPYFDWLPITEDDKDKLFATWKLLVDSKVVRPQDEDEAHARASLDFPEMNEEAAKSRAETNQAMSPIPPAFGAPKLGPDGKPLPFQPKPALTPKQFEQLVKEFAR